VEIVGILVLTITFSSNEYLFYFEKRCCCSAPAGFELQGSVVFPFPPPKLLVVQVCTTTWVYFYDLFLKFLSN
jgi:hypothetical protein